MGLKDRWQRAQGWAPVSLAKATLQEFSDDKALRLGAALAYYSIFSIAPLLLIAVAVAGLFFGTAATQERLLSTIRDLVGAQGAEAVGTMMENAARPREGIIATVAGVAALLFGAAGLFAQLQGALNTVWDVREKKGLGWKHFVRNRLFSFAMVVSVGFLLLVSLVVSAVLSAVGDFLSATLPGGAVLWMVVNFAVSLAVTTLLFALVFKFVPDVHIAWRDVWIGAFATAVLFTLGKFVIGLYLGNSSVASVYGAAGSLVVLLLWIYYSAQIVLLGAEFTQVYANRYGSHLRPEEDAVAIGEAQEGEAAGSASRGRRGRPQG